MKKFISLILILMLIFTVNLTTFASELSLQLEANEVNGSERLIEISWDNTGFYEIQIDTDINFRNPKSCMNADRRITSYCFRLTDNINETYYIRISNDGGETWSNTVTASINNEIKIETKPYLNFPSVPPIKDFSDYVKQENPETKEETEIEEEETETTGVFETEVLEETTQQKPEIYFKNYKNTFSFFEKIFRLKFRK